MKKIKKLAINTKRMTAALLSVLIMSPAAALPSKAESIYSSSGSSETPIMDVITGDILDGEDLDGSSSSFTEGTVSLDFRSDTNSDKKLTHSFYYSDSFFADKSTVYSHDLAKMTLGLVAAGFSTGESDSFWALETKEENQFSRFNPGINVFRSKNIVQAYKKLGFVTDDIKLYNYNVTLNDSSDKTAFSIAHKSIVIDGKKYELAAVIIRGGGYGAEWASNFNIGDNGNYHEAFNSAADKVTTEILKYLKDYNLGSNVKIWLGGFSRAAATANLTAAKLDDMSNRGELSVSRDDIFAYTFATPQGIVDNESNSIHSELYDNIFNIVNPCDLVPTVALSRWGFSRYGRTMTLPYIYFDNSDPSRELPAFTASSDSTSRKNTVTAQYSELTGEELDSLNAFSINRSTIDSVDKSLYKLADSPETYVDKNYQKTIMNIFEFMYTDNLIGSLSDKKTSPAVFLVKVAANMKKCFGIEISDVLSETSEIKDRLPDYETVTDTLKDVFNGDAKKTDVFLDALYTIIGRELPEEDESLRNFQAYNIIDTVAKLVTMEQTAIGDNHYPELYMSWLEAYDSGELFADRTYKKITVSGSADIKVTAGDGSVVANISDSTVTRSFVPIYTEGGSHEIWLIDEGDYKITISGGSDSMTCTAEEYDKDLILQSRTNYYDIDINADSLYEITVTPNRTVLTDIKDKSNVQVSEEVTPDNKNAYSKITLTSDGNGYVYGEQSVLRGEYVSVSAGAKDGYKFSGWYIGENKVSGNDKYYLSVNDDVSLKAVFEKKGKSSDSDSDKDSDTDTGKAIGIMGDLDKDGKITSADSLIILRASVGLEDLSKSEEKLADADKDGQVTSSDALYVLRSSVGLNDIEGIGQALYEN